MGIDPVPSITELGSVCTKPNTGTCHFRICRIFKYQFPDSAEGGFLPWGWSKRVSAMTHKGITLEFVVPTLLAIALAIVLSIGAVHLIENYLGPIDQAEANYSAPGRD
jgi:hypothetical protein